MNGYLRFSTYNATREIVDICYRFGSVGFHDALVQREGPVSEEINSYSHFMGKILSCLEIK